MGDWGTSRSKINFMKMGKCFDYEEKQKTTKERLHDLLGMAKIGLLRPVSS